MHFVVAGSTLIAEVYVEMDAAAMAAENQTSSGFAVDVWVNIMLPPMLKLWQLEWQRDPGHYFLSEEDAREATGAYSGTKPHRFAETLWRMVQIRSSDETGYRQEMFEFVVDRPVSAAMGICSANADLGSGSVLQYFLPDKDGHLLRTGRSYKFQEWRYSK